MSDMFLPTLPGLSWNTTKAPRFNTKVQTSVNLSELRSSFAATPVYDFTRSYDLLRDNTADDELHELGGFFMARYGSWDKWLFADPDDSIALLEPFDTGDGVTVAFQLQRTFGVFIEPVCNVAAAPLIYKAGVLQTVTTDYTVSATGLVTFTTAPAAAAALTWSGTYYFRCRFEQDAQEYQQFMSRLWQARSFGFKGSLGTKI
jgi:uncharacterized protein (TIGR02217 family)